MLVTMSTKDYFISYLALMYPNTMNMMKITLIRHLLALYAWYACRFNEPTNDIDLISRDA